MRLTLSVIDDFAALGALAPAWQRLLARSATDEPTLTPLWLGAWWRVFGNRDGRELAVVTLSDAGQLVGLAPLCRRRHRYAPGLEFRRLELIGSGETERDEICSDYIGVLAERGREQEIARALAGALAAGAAGSFDELVMPAMNAESLLPWALTSELSALGISATLEASAPSPYAPLPSSWDGYLGALPASRRQHVRRSLRDFERWSGGQHRFLSVETPGQIETGLGVLEALHAERWRGAGTEGAFASSLFSRFHRLVMPELLEAKMLELRWLVVGDTPVAAIYNLVHAGKTYFYQSGRKTSLPSHVRPGIVLHARSIQHAIEQGRREYDFLPGPSRYKLELSLATRPLVRLRAARPGVREAALLVGRTLHARIRANRPTEPVAPWLQLLQGTRAKIAGDPGPSPLAPDLAQGLSNRVS
jgi:CelD/BcsL family acetyltransferase involved in cellulose biosynthesis